MHIDLLIVQTAAVYFTLSVKCIPTCNDPQGSLIRNDDSPVLPQISAKLEFDDELSPVPTLDQFECDGGDEYADDLKRVVDLLASLG